MKNIEVIRTDKKGLEAFYKKYFVILYSKKHKKLTGKEATQKASNFIKDFHDYNIYDFEYNKIFTKNEVIDILKKAKAKIEIETTEATSL